MWSELQLVDKSVTGNTHMSTSSLAVEKVSYYWKKPASSGILCCESQQKNCFGLFQRKYVAAEHKNIFLAHASLKKTISLMCFSSHFSVAV